MNVFNGVKSPDVLSYHCILPVGFSFNLTYGLIPNKSVASKLSLFTDDPFSKLSGS